MKSERGITLFSLVITIIVMVILAGVAVYIGVIEDDEGLINRVKEETTKEQEMVQEEKDKMNIDSNKIPSDNTQTPKKEEYEQIATYTTTIYDKDQNRVDNITLANSKLNNEIFVYIY